MSGFGKKSRKNSEVIDSLSRMTPLGAGEVFEPAEFIEILGAADISISVLSDVDSAIDGLMLQWSSDGITPDTADDHTIFANEGQKFTHGTLYKFFRIKYTNGPAPQTNFKLQTIVSPIRRKPSTHRLGNNLTTEDDAELVKAVLAGEDEFKVYRNILATRFGKATASLFDSQTNSSLLITPNGQLNTGELVRLTGGNFVGGQPLLPHTWTLTPTGSGGSVTAEGELNLSTGVTPNSSSRLTSFRKARFITATFNLAHLAISTPGFQNADVVRRWGVFDPIATSLGLNGVFFENNAGNYSVVRVKNGVEEDRVPEIGWSAPNLLIKNNDVAVYEIFYNAGTIFFFQNRKLLHVMSSLDSAAYNSPHLRAGATVENVNGNAVDNLLVSRGFAISRIGANSAIPEPFHIIASGTFVIKNTPARLHRVIINNKGTGAATLQMFNNFEASGEVIGEPSTSDVSGSIEYQIELDEGLTVVAMGAQIDATVVFD